MNAVADQALWALGRGTGIVALVMFTIALVLGVVSRSGREIRGFGRFGINELHRTASLTGVGLLAVHIVSLLFDPYAQLRVFDAIIPFAGQFKPLWQGLGTLAADMIIVVTAVSLLRNEVGPRLFRAVHWGTYVLWPLALAHAVGNGTDGTSGWLVTLAAACTAAVLVAVGWRLTARFGERGYRGDRTPRTPAHRQRKVTI